MGFGRGESRSTSDHFGIKRKDLETGDIAGVDTKEVDRLFWKSSWKLGKKEVLCVKKWQKYCCCTFPMRNWHINYCVDSFLILLLYLSYEELTQFYKCFFFFSHAVVPFLWGIDTLLRSSLSDMRWKSCTFPMRNWHNFTLFINQSPAKVVPFLWGIDTVA